MLNDYSCIERKALESLIQTLEERRKGLNQEMIQAHTNRLFDLVGLYRGQYFATGLVIEDLRKLLIIPYDDLIVGVRLRKIDDQEVFKQLKLRNETAYSSAIVSLETLAKLLVASWRNEYLDIEEYVEFMLLRTDILKQVKSDLYLRLQYGVSQALSEIIVRSWKDE